MDMSVAAVLARQGLLPEGYGKRAEGEAQAPSVPALETLLINDCDSIAVEPDPGAAGFWRAMLGEREICRGQRHDVTDFVEAVQDWRVAIWERIAIRSTVARVDAAKADLMEAYRERVWAEREAGAPDAAA